VDVDSIKKNVKTGVDVTHVLHTASGCSLHLSVPAQHCRKRAVGNIGMGAETRDLVHRMHTSNVQRCAVLHPQSHCTPVAAGQPPLHSKDRTSTTSQSVASASSTLAGHVGGYARCLQNSRKLLSMPLLRRIELLLQ